MCRFRVVALMIGLLGACVADVGATQEDKNNLGDFESVQIGAIEGDVPLLTFDGSTIERRFSIETETLETKVLEVRSTEVILRVPSVRKALKLAIGRTWNEFGLEVAIRGAGESAFRPLVGANDAYFTEITFDRALGAYSGTMRKYDGPERVVGDLVAVPEPLMHVDQGTVDLRIRMTPISGWGDIGSGVLGEIGSYRPLLRITDAEQDLVFQDVFVETDTSDYDGHHHYIRTIIGRYVDGETLKITIDMVDNDQNQELDDQQSMLVRIESSRDASVHASRLWARNTADGPMFRTENLSQRTLPSDLASLRYLMAYELTTSMRAYNAHLIDEELYRNYGPELSNCSDISVMVAAVPGLAIWAVAAVAGAPLLGGVYFVIATVIGGGIGTIGCAIAARMEGEWLRVSHAM